MMSSNEASSFLSSTPFTVIAPSGKRFWAHGELLSRHSNVFKVEVEGEMQEAIRQTIRIESVDDDIDDDTVMRFLHFIYEEDYPVPKATIKKPEQVLESEVNGKIEHDRASTAVLYDHNGNVILPEPAPEPANIATKDDWGSWGSSKKDKKKKKKDWGFGEQSSVVHGHWADIEDCDAEATPDAIKTKVTDDSWVLSSRPYGTTRKKAMVDSFQEEVGSANKTGWQPDATNDPNTDNTNVLLTHVRLYIFSNRYGCEGLQRCALQKLHQTLAQYIVTPENANEVIIMVRHAYAHTYEYEGPTDKLRLLIVHFVTCYIETLCHNKDFRDLLCDPGALSVDLVTRMLQRLD